MVQSTSSKNVTANLDHQDSDTSTEEADMFSPVQSSSQVLRSDVEVVVGVFAWGVRVTAATVLA